jgi:hypothetical protein
VNSRGTPGVKITALAARQESVSPEANIAPALQIVKTTQVPMPGQRAPTSPRRWTRTGDLEDRVGHGRRRAVRRRHDRLLAHRLPGRHPHTISVRATDERGARTVAATKVVVQS